MKMLKFAGIFSILVLSMSTPSSWARTSKKIKQPQETYPAFEPDTDSAPPHSAVAAESPQPPAASEAAKKKPAVAAKGGYELVPSTQAEPIIHRLKIVEELIRKFGRAYDYRVHTVKELQSILSQLEASRNAQLPEPPAPVSSPAAEPGATAAPTRTEAPKDASPAFSPDISAETL